jgi:hypothetical protein
VIPTSTDEIGLLAVIVLRPSHASRNRHFALFTTHEARRARRRASVLRGVVGDLSGSFGPARLLGTEPRDGETVIRYALPRVTLERTARLSREELALVRVALARRGLRLLPAALVAREEDESIAEALLARGGATLAARTGS